ncbi:hypothetical protein JMUB7522_27250 [Staphylococcus aureus]
MLNNIHEETKSTMIIVEHRLEESLDDTFDRVLLFKDGKIIANTTPSDLLKSSKLKEAGIREPLYCTAPVSYTHLRAHETTLHLVCRLLLEKSPAGKGD